MLGLRGGSTGTANMMGVRDDGHVGHTTLDERTYCERQVIWLIKCCTHPFDTCILIKQPVL